MRNRPSVADRLTAVAAMAHARHVYRRFLRAAHRAVQVQDRVLLEKIRRNADSRFGRDYRFDRIRTPADFRKHLPILTYDDHAPYIERVKNGDPRALFGAAERVHMFALTSGTTDTPKFIPVTDSFLREYRSGWNAFGIKALLDHPQAILRRIVQVSSRIDESRTEAGIPCGAITGLMAATQKRLVRKYYATPACLAGITDPPSKYYAIMRVSVPLDVAFLITASPATQLKLAQAADTHRERLIRDIHDGTLDSALDIPADVRSQLRPQLAPAPAVAERLEKLIDAHGRLLPRHYWNLNFLANWTGGTMGLHLRDFPEYFGDVPVRDVGLLASEGRVSIPVEDGTCSGILDVTANFFEFIPRDEIELPTRSTLRCHELEVGQEYFVLLTTSSGLYRYDLGDLVRVNGYEGQAPVIEFLNKGAHTCSLTGEKLTEHQVILAMDTAVRGTPGSALRFVVAPRWGHPPHYVLHVDAAHCPAHESLAEELDRCLCAVNVEYDSRRRSHRLGPLELNLLPPDFLGRWDREQAEARRPGNEQYKHRYLFTQPGDDEAFPQCAGPAQARPAAG